MENRGDKWRGEEISGHPTVRDTEGSTVGWLNMHAVCFYLIGRVHY